MLRICRLAAYATILSLMGCVPARNPVTAISGISEAELTLYEGNGPCSVHGQAFLKTRGGDVKYGAGETVTLMPDIRLLNEIIGINSIPRQYAVLQPDIDRKWQALKRQTQADGEGKFEFNTIPCGAWFVESRVTWEVIQSQYSSSIQGGPVSSRVKVSPQNSPARVMLTY